MKKWVQDRRAEIQRGKEELALDRVRRQNRRMKKLGSMPDGTIRNVRMGIMNKQSPKDVMRNEYIRRKQRREEKYGEKVPEH